MIRRYLTPSQRIALYSLQYHNGIPAMSLRRYDVAIETIYALKREKLVVEGDDARYRITEAGAAALESGLYEKQPQLLIIRVSSAPKPEPLKSSVPKTPSHNGRSA